MTPSDFAPFERLGNGQAASVERCFACGRPLGKTPARVDTRDSQTVLVGSDCFRRVLSAGEAGYQPPLGGPRLYPLSEPTPEPTSQTALRKAGECSCLPLPEPTDDFCPLHGDYAEEPDHA